MQSRANRKNGFTKYEMISKIYFYNILASRKELNEYSQSRLFHIGNEFPFEKHEKDRLRDLAFSTEFPKSN